MSKYKLKYFGEIDTKNLDDYYDVESTYNGRDISFDLNFGAKKIDEIRLERVQKVLDNLDDFDAKNREFIKKDFDKYPGANIVYDYLLFHLEELGDVFESFINKDDTKENNLKRLMATLKLRRVGFYPDEEEETVIFDYCLNDEVSDELIVIAMKNYKIDYVTWES